MDIMRKRKTTNVDKLYKTFISIDHGEEKPLSKTFFVSLVEQESIIFLFTKDRPRGYLIARSLGDEIEILFLFIDISFRRKGLGKKLLCELKTLAFRNNILKIILEVSFLNKKAISLYEKTGFSELAVRKKYYVCKDKKVDAKLMYFKIDG